MNSPAHEYLANLPMLFISVPEHKERRAQFMENTAPLFKSVTWVEAHPIVDVVEEANDFIRRVQWSREHCDPEGWFRETNIFGIKSFRSATKRAREYAVVRSLSLSTLKACIMARELGYERFMLMEDDAFPRHDIIEQMALPPDDADMAVWGGAYGNGGIKGDNHRYLSGQEPRWVVIGRKRFFTQAYEMTAHGASVLEKAYRNHFYAADMTWWYAHREMPSYVVYPSAFIQRGGSTRAVRFNPDREGVTDRHLGGVQANRILDREEAS